MDSLSFNIVANRIDSLDLSPRANAMAHGLLLGDKQYFTYCEKQEMRNAGMSHIVAVSGLHIGILYLVLFLALNPLRWFGLLRSHRVLVSALLWLYVIVIGWPVSAVRAALMLSLASLSWILKRHTAGIRILLTTAIIILLFDPRQLTDVGFLLSFLATLGILMLSSVANRQDPVTALLVVTLSAQLATFPVVAYYFHTVPVLGWIQGLLVIPLLSFLVYALLLYLLFPALSFLSLPIEWIIDWIFLVADVSSWLEQWLLGGHLAFYPSWWEAILWEGAVLGLLFCLRRYQHS